MEHKLVSASLLARRAYGRYARQGFYAGEADKKCGKLFFVNNFKELVENPPQGIAESARNKMAVFYTDGNSFTQLSGRTVEERKAFSTQLRRLMRKELLTPLLEELEKLQQNEHTRKFVSIEGEEEAGGKGLLRFETLLWGGDEVMFVMPAWLGLWFTARFFQLIRDWQSPAGESLTFGAGLLICNYKTPIRVAKKIVKNELAEAAATWGKQQKSTQNAISIFVMESIEPMEEGLLEIRKRQLGLKDNLEDALIIPGDKLDEALKKAQELRERFPDMEIVLWDERYTTEEAIRRLGKRSDDLDAVAAQIILEEYLHSL